MIEKTKEVLENIIDYALRETCLHEETHREGVIWEICDSCGMKWADDKGGKPKNAHALPKEIIEAQELLRVLNQ